MNEIIIHGNGKPLYPIIFSEDYRGLRQALLRVDIGRSKTCIVTDSNVAPLYLGRIKDACRDIFYSCTEFIFDAGEKNKNLDTLQDLWEHLVRNGFERGDVLIALGGGVTGDLCGYAAASYMRGIRFIQIPTSLLAQVDSSIGGKTGIDFRSYKNMLGAFHQPSLVYSAAEALETLPEREFVSGMAEVIKHGLIRDRVYYSKLMNSRESLIARDRDTLVSVITKSDMIKRDIVESDPYERGERALLNFGHTIGHAIEKYMNFSMLHGECVALGMVVAIRISILKGLVHEDAWQSVSKDIESFGLPVRFSPDAYYNDNHCRSEDVSVSDIQGIAEEILRISHRDKKIDGGKHRFILLKSLGDAFISRDVKDEEIIQGIYSLMEC